MPDEEPSVAPAAAKPNKMKAMIVVGGIMAVEAGLIFGVMKMVGTGPSGAAAADVEGTGSEEATGQGQGEESVKEVVIAETDAYNSRSGRLYLYHLRVSALVEAGNQSTLEKLVEERQGTMLDRINTVIRGADPNHLNEPGLETLRRQIKFELDKISGDASVIKELLIPQLLQTRSNL
ncbi:MAG: hypothetical protein ACE5GE_00475 [Phycisphaerae bacterium]